MYDSLDPAECLRELVIHSLAGSLAAAGFRVHYQPIVRLTDRAIVAVEALARWRHPTLGDIDARHFIPLAESCGLIDIIDEFVLDRACADADSLESACGGPIDVHVNVSASRLGGDRLELALARTLYRGCLRPDRLVLEITETAQLTEVDSAVAAAQRIRAQGVRLAIDDFGAGFSWLKRLHELPVDIMKIDAALTRVEQDPARCQPMCEALMRLGRAMRLSIVAEGIESIEQAERLASIGCEIGQGYLYGKPQPLLNTVGKVDTLETMLELEDLPVAV
jgi:EAL domain-containing protein (putative c-di-GMP-specific phosphodiesterase class I)